MSMHKIPLTQIEEAGLRAHGLDIGTPSQLSDAFRQGVRFARAQLPSQGGEAVEVVAYMDKNSCLWNDTTHPGRMTQLMTVAQHQRILAALSAENQRFVPVEPLLAAPHPFDQIVGRVHHNEFHKDPVRAVLNSVGRKLPDNTPLYTHPADQVADDLTMVKVSRELLQDLRDLAFDQVEHHRAAMGAYKQTRQSAMDSVLAQADDQLAKSEGMKK